MIPFPGESITVRNAAADADTTLGLDIRYRGSETGFTAGYRTLAAGAQWRAWVTQGNWSYLPGPDEDAVVSWVVEVVSGTVTVDAGEAYDTSFSTDRTLAPSSSAGTYTVTGPATLVIPSGFTVAQVYDDPGDRNYMMLHLAATSGSAVIQQIKLRVWPPGGPLGGWSDLKPEWDTTPQAPGIRGTALNSAATVDDADAETAWDGAVSAFHTDTATVAAATARTLPTVSSSGSISAGQQMLTIEGGYRGQTSLNARLYVLEGASMAGRSPIQESVYHGGTDWIRPPEEVSGDFNYYGQQDGTALTDWSSQNLAVTSTSDPDSMPGALAVHSLGGDYTPTSSGVWTVAATHGTATASTSVPLAVTTGDRRALVTVSHSVAVGDSDAWPGWLGGGSGQSWQETVTFSLAAVRSWLHMPPYRIWDPTAVVARVIPLRQFHRDDGLGVTPPRAFGGASRIRTGRAYGYD